VYVLVTQGHLPVGKREIVKGSFGKEGKREGHQGETFQVFFSVYRIYHDYYYH